MYNGRDSLTSRHKITPDELIYHKKRKNNIRGNKIFTTIRFPLSIGRVFRQS